MVQQKLIFSDKIENEDEIHQKEKLVPKIRFSEFNDNWNIIKIENNAIIKGIIGWKNLKSEEYREDVGLLDSVNDYVRNNKRLILYIMNREQVKDDEII